MNLVMDDGKYRIAYRFERSFVFWLEMITSAFASYRREDIEVDGESATTEDIKFNFTRYYDYDKKLQEYFENAQDEIANAIAGIYNKLDKLDYLTKYLAEVYGAATLLIKDETGQLCHRKFEFANISENKQHRSHQMSENDFQQCYTSLEYSLNKMKHFLETTKGNIQSIAQGDIPIPAMLLPNPNISTTERPLAFFDWFFTRNGLNITKQNFISFVCNDGDYYDEEKEARVWDQPMQEDYETYERKEVFFKDDLHNLLVKELYMSCQLIAEHIDGLSSYESIKLRVHLILRNLDYYLKRIAAIKLYEKYEECVTVVQQLQRYIKDRYEDFYSKEHLLIGTVPSHIEMSDQKLTTSSDRIDKKSFKSFTILGNQSDGVVLALHEYLLKGRLIAPDTEVLNFSRAFDGSYIEKPLKIKWVAVGRNKKVNKQSLLYLLNRLGGERIIDEETTNALFLKRVELVFCDEKGNRLENLKVSNANSGKAKKTTTDDKRKVDAIVAHIKSIFFSKID